MMSDLRCIEEYGGSSSSSAGIPLTIPTMFEVHKFRVTTTEIRTRHGLSPDKK